MFCKDGNIPISVFYKHFIDAFFVDFDPRKLIEIELSEYETSANENSYQLRLGMDAALTVLHGCETFTATSVNGVHLRVDPEIFLTEPSTIFLEQDYEKLGALGALGASERNEFSFMFVHSPTFLVSLALWDEIFQPRIKRIKSEFLKIQNKDTDLFDEIEVIAKKIQLFEGWSLSISNVEATSVLGKILDNYPFKEAVEKRGRKRLNKAREYWQFEMKFSRGNKSWMQVARLIKNKTNEEPSPKSLRDWEKNPLPPRD